MRVAFTLVMLLIVAAVVGINVRNQLRATALANGAAGAASAPFGGSSSPSVGQFQQELDKTMQVVDARAASAGDAADTQR